MSAHKNCHAHGYVRTCVSSFLLALFLFFIFPLIFSKGNNFRVSFGTPPEEKENRILLLLLLLLLPVALLLFFFRSRQKFYCIHQVHSWVCRRLQLLSATRGGGGGGGVAMHVVEFLIMMMMILWIIHSLIDCLFVCLFFCLLAWCTTFFKL